MEEGIQSIIDTDYERWVLTIRARFQRAKVSASLKVNNELLRFYLSVGKDIYNNQYENRYGSQFYKRLSIDLQREIPNSKGFSPTNLKYMRYFYELFKDEIQNRPQVVDDLVCLPWGHIRYIIDNCKNDLDKALFFVGKTLENNWSRAVLLIQPSSILFSVHPPHPSGAPAGPRRRLRGGRGRARSRHRRRSRGRG